MESNGRLGIFIPGLAPDLSLSTASPFQSPFPLKAERMERGDSSRGSRASDEVDGPPATQRRRTDDRAFGGSGRVLNTGGLSASGPMRIAARGQAGPSQPVVVDEEEQALAHAAAADVEERADALLRHLEDADRHGIGTLMSFTSFLCLSYSHLDKGGLFTPAVMTELEHLRAAVDSFANFLRVAAGTREERLMNARRRVLEAIESGVRRGTGVALAMAELATDEDLTGLNGLPEGAQLRYHEDLVAHYGPAREAVAALVPPQQVLAELP